MLSKTIKSQLVNVKVFLDKNGVDTSYLDFINPDSAAAAPRNLGNTGAPAAPAPHISAERQRDRIERRRHRGPDAQAAPWHRERGR